ncbi:hypothetical protein OH738_15255 [Streptomyces hirsutus]|uniref:hypothetical protein n=1 Tax=Streptomyces hirsutus TaxID=35620 RepID=UPI00386D5CE2|nr:hypothetical protein OH738_15255 [Streptomyces hirsutus]
MADEQYRWLNRETAERLLNGESPEAVGPADRDQAERLSSALGALSAPPPPAGGELPGEAAALAAFRKVREERTGRAAGAVSAVPVAPRAGAAQGTDVGLVRIGAPSADRSGTGRAPRWARPVRFGLAVALTVGMVGGVAVLAGTGVLPTPSGVSGPAATATATGPPERPLPPHPSKKDAPGGVAPGEEQGEPSGDADGDTGWQDGPGTGADEDGGLAETGVKTGDLGPGNGRGKQIASACRALHDGRKLPGNRRRLLEGAAGGSAHVGPYCENILAHHGTGADTGTGSGPGSGPTTKRDGGNDNGNGRSGNGNGNGNDNGSNEGAANGNGSNGNAGNGNAGNGKGNGKGNANGNKGDSGQDNGQGNGQGNGQDGQGNGGKHGKGADASG